MARSRWVSWAAGLAAGVAGTLAVTGLPRVWASTSDRFEDYIMATGAVAVSPRALTDGVWLLDYRGGKLLGTVIDRNTGTINGWADVDLVSEFGLPARQNVHFMMVTGSIAAGQAALYVAETTTGKFAVYTMGPNPAGPGVVIRRHDMKNFRKSN